MAVGYILLILVLIFVVATLLWLYIFSIYEIRYKPVYYEQIANSSKILIYCTPLNSLGLKAPLRKVTYNVDVIKGESLIKNVVCAKSQIIIEYFDSGDSKISISVSSSLSLFPYRLTIN